MKSSPKSLLILGIILGAGLGVSSMFSRLQIYRVERLGESLRWLNRELRTAGFKAVTFGPDFSREGGVRLRGQVTSRSEFVQLQSFVAQYTNRFSIQMLVTIGDDSPKVQGTLEQ